ncbi:MAG: TetR family transcriptional regulator [Proteobacteria bacterium]|nr:TetR family transcriptional regulator [Pseudomonadota bacterium]MBU1740030.1 TetR family transcriptional regulator [Pseudomonadota bacterium]
MGTKGQASRQRLVTAARKMFRHQGFTKTSIDDIARAARLNRGIVYFHFKNKDDLAVAALDQALESEFELLEGFMGDETNALTRLELMIDGLVRFNAERGCRGG